MSRTITLKLTEKEANALCHAIGNSLSGDETELLALFNEDRASMRSALRAFKKLTAAINGGGVR